MNKNQQNQHGGKRDGAGRKLGSTKRPQISDYVTEKEVKGLLKEAKKLAKKGDGNMIRFLIDHCFGRAKQAIEHTGEDGSAIEIENNLSPEAEKNIAGVITQAFLDNTTG